jgi:nucleoside-diphosphate-sugar epimerase
LILVTGGCGFVGSYLVKSLVEDGLKVVVFDVVVPSTLPEPLRGVADEVEIVKGDVSNLGDLLRTFTAYDIDYIVHLAWVMGEEEPWSSLKVNVEGTSNVLEMARLMKTKRVVFASSEDVYGSAAVQSEPVKEDAPLWPAARKDHLIYASTKAMGEYLCDLYHYTSGLDFIVLRFSTAYGFAPRKGWVVDIFEKPVQQVPYVVPRGNADKYSFIYVKDFAKAIKSALKIKNPEFRTFNVSGGAYNIQYLIDTVKKFIPQATIQAELGKDPSRTPAIMDITRARKILGFEPSYPLEKGVQEYIDKLRA